MKDYLEIKPGENIFAALGFEGEEAEQLAAESARRIAAKEEVKKTLVAGIKNWMTESDLTQEEAANELGVSRPRVSDLVRGRLDLFSMQALIGMALKTGKRVELALH